MSRVFHQPLRWCVAGLCLTGTGLCALAAVRAFTRMGALQTLTFTTIGLVLAGTALAVIRGYQWALIAAAVVLAGQVGAVAGTIWELRGGIADVKAQQLRLLGFDPTLGVVINLIYSSAASVLFGWLLIRWVRYRRANRATSALNIRSQTRR